MHRSTTLEIEGKNRVLTPYVRDEIIVMTIQEILNVFIKVRAIGTFITEKILEDSV